MLLDDVGYIVEGVDYCGVGVFVGLGEVVVVDFDFGVEVGCVDFGVDEVFVWFFGVGYDCDVCGEEFWVCGVDCDGVGVVCEGEFDCVVCGLLVVVFEFGLCDCGVEVDVL